MNEILININNVSLTFAELERPIISDLSYQVKTGDFVVILGSNGSGKSSLIKMIDQRYPVSKGNILLSERNIKNYPLKEFHHIVKTLTQNADDSLFTSLTVLENFLIVKQQYEPHLFSLRAKHEREFLADYLSAFNVNLANKLEGTVSMLSGGEKQALALALTVLYPPKILLLDEHTSALDPKTAENIMALTQKTVEKTHITCMLTTHDLDIAERYGNRLLALKNGMIHQQYDGVAKTQVSKAELLTACY